MKRRANGEGTIFKRKDGRWSAQAYVTLANGVQKRVCVTARSREAVRIKLREILDHEARRVPYAEKDWTVGEYLDYWMRVIQPNRIRESTAEMYNGIIDKYINAALGHYKLNRLSVCDVRQALGELKKLGCSGRTQQKFLQILSSCLTCAMREEVIYRNVTQLIEKPKHIPKETIIWTAEQAALFLRKIKNCPQYMAFLLILTYGMRRGEVLGLRWSDIDFENRVIHIRQQIGRINGKIMARELKTTNSRRKLPLIDNIRTSLMEHAEKKGIIPPPFSPYHELSTCNTVVISKANTPLEPRNLRRCFDTLIEKTGVPRITIHAMRHTAATILKDLNVPVKDAQLILGHSDISTTLNIYQHGTVDTHRYALSAVEGLLLKKQVTL